MELNITTVESIRYLHPVNVARIVAKQTINRKDLVNIYLNAVAFVLIASNRKRQDEASRKLNEIASEVLAETDRLIRDYRIPAGIPHTVVLKLGWRYVAMGSTAREMISPREAGQHVDAMSALLGEQLYIQQSRPATASRQVQ